MGLGPPRSVLGELSSNLGTKRPGAAKGSKQAGPTSFSIFCDDETSVAAEQLKPGKPKLWHQGNKENSFRSQGENKEVTLKSLGGDKENSYRSSRDAKPLVHEGRLAIRRPPPMQERPISISSDDSIASMDSEDYASSPMLLDTSAQQWRVPPLSSQGQTVDIFSDPEYNQDIYNYLRSTELKLVAKTNYMSKQPDITHSMRQILVDWLVEVSEEYKLQTETLYLAVSYIDRFLSVMSVQRAKLQLVGTAAMFIASKYEEIYPPDVGEFVYITDDTYNKRQVLRMEHLVLKVLEFDISVPTSHLFVSKLGQMAKCDDRTMSFAMYLNELSLLSGDFLQFSPSLVAAASVALARHTLGQPAWPDQVAEMSGYRLADFQACLLALHQAHVAAEDCPQQAIREKYKASKHHGVSDIAPALLARSL